jgi:hypothetical protein
MGFCGPEAKIASGRFVARPLRAAPHQHQTPNSRAAAEACSPQGPPSCQHLPDIEVAGSDLPCLPPCLSVQSRQRNSTWSGLGSKRVNGRRRSEASLVVGNKALNAAGDMAFRCINACFTTASTVTSPAMCTAHFSIRSLSCAF